MRRLFSLLLALTLLAGLAFSMVQSGSIAPAAEAASAEALPIYVEKNEEAGLYGRVYPMNTAGFRYIFFVPSGANLSQLAIEWTAETKVTDSNGNPLSSGALTLEQLGAGVYIKVGTQRALISMMQGSSGVRAMFLETDTSIPGFSSFAAVNADKKKETEAAGTMSFGSETGYHFSIKGRGNSNWQSAKKKPYNITLYKDNTYDKKLSAELIEGVEAKKWTLTANYYDTSLLRCKTGYDMARAMGIGLATDFVDLYVDGQYMGNYLLTPKNDYAAPEEGFVVEIDNWTDAEDPQFNLDGMVEYHPSRDGFQHRITVKDNGAKLPTEDIKTYMQAAWDSLLDEESDAYLAYIDLDSWAKYYLLHEFYKSFDVVCGSILMHRDGTADTDKLMAGPVWDLDNTMGRVNENADLGLTAKQQHSPDGWYIKKVFDPEAWEGGEVVPVFWLQQLGRHESFMTRVYQLYYEYKSVFDGAADALTADIQLLENSANMNFVLANSHSGAPAITETDKCGCVVTNQWLDYANNLKNFVTKRAAFLANNIPDPNAPTQPTTPTTPTTPATTPTTTGTAFSPIFDNNPLVIWLIFGGIAFAVAITVSLVKHYRKK